jgi:hypothetical protein
MAPWAGFTNKGGVDITAYLIGSWEELVAVAGGSNYQLGNCPEGVLEASKEFYRHEDTQFPRKVDLVVPIRAGYKFTGRLEEIHSQNVSLLLGQTLDVGVQNYIYIGALDQSYFFSLRGRRTRVSDGVAIEFRIHKCIQASLFSLASGDETQGSPLEVEGLDDTAGGYGGSATMPLGWIYVPSMA